MHQTIGLFRILICASARLRSLPDRICVTPADRAYLPHHIPAGTLGSLAPRLLSPGGDAYDAYVDDDPDSRGHPD